MLFKIFKCISDCEFYLIDKKRDKIIKLAEGKFSDITLECEKKAKKDKQKDNPWIATSLYNDLKNVKDYYTYDLILGTNEQKEFDKKIFEIQKEQLEKKLKLLNYNLEELRKGRQYYTYELSNV